MCSSLYAARRGREEGEGGEEEETRETHREANVSLFQRGCVVGAIARYAHNLTELLEAPHELQLILRATACHHLQRLHLPVGQQPLAQQLLLRLVRELAEVRALYRAALARQYPTLLCNVLGRQQRVTCYISNRTES
jgi:hypothetical protein